MDYTAENYSAGNYTAGDYTAGNYTAGFPSFWEATLYTQVYIIFFIFA